VQVGDLVTRRRDDGGEAVAVVGERDADVTLPGVEDDDVAGPSPRVASAAIQRPSGDQAGWAKPWRRSFLRPCVQSLRDLQVMMPMLGTPSLPCERLKV
jgi:hypothetical protein